MPSTANRNAMTGPKYWPTRSVPGFCTDSIAQFLDRFKTPMPSWDLLDYRQRAEELEQRRNPPPVKTEYARGSMEWQAEQGKREHVDYHAAQTVLAIGAGP